MGITYTSVETTKLSTAEVYAQMLTDIAKDDPRIVVLTTDLAKSTKIGVFSETFPERFYNFGIAEQNMYGVAAGMAKCGLVPFTSAFAVFNSMRALDQVHTDICYQNLNVKMIASHAGTSFGQAGSTHHAVEDIAIMRSMANLTVIVPADGIETANAVKACVEMDGPVYIRINRGFDQVLYDNMDYGYEIGKAVKLHEGTDLCIIACGCASFQALQAAMADRQARLGAASQLGGLGQQAFQTGQTIQQQQAQQGLLQQSIQQALIDAARQQYAGYTGAPSQALQAPLAALGVTPTPQTTTNSMQPGLFNYLQLGASMVPG